VEEDVELCEDGGVLQEARPDEVSDKALGRGASQLGSLGSGNHFLEVQVVEEILEPVAANAMGLFAGQVCVMIHSGSRGLGHQVCTDHVKVMDELTHRLGIEVPDRQLACAPLSHEAAERYLGAMYAAANFARANRHVLADGVGEAFEGVFRRSAGDLGLGLVYDVSHNLAKIEEHELDGRARRLCVHRKGATRAFGPGHSDVPAAYRSIGQPVVIPGSMGTASYVLVGLETSAARSNQPYVEEHRSQFEAYEAFCDELGEQPAVVALAWLLHQPAVTAPIIGPRTLDQLTASQRALEVDMADDAFRRLDEIWPGPGGEAPQAYAW
jgi:tRNA-splicing ligase RtcB (3'-phosphate/5'-hydroxy nucleic acid ligase)